MFIDLFFQEFLIYQKIQLLLFIKGDLATIINFLGEELEKI